MPGSRPIIEYYFSFISLWSYIGSRRLQALAADHDARIVYKPVDLLHVFSVSGGLPVAQRPAQRQAYRLLEMERWRRIRDVALVRHPRFYPADPSLAHRVLLAALAEEADDGSSSSSSGGPVHEFARRGLATVWADEADIADPATVVAVADACGLEGARLLERARRERALVEREEALTREAVERQYFGAPMYVYRDEPFWGQDRLEMLDEVLRSGREPIRVN